MRRCIVGPAAISSADTTGGTASATATAARRERIPRGWASNTTTSGWTSSWSSAGCSGTEPYIAVNSGLGDSRGAVEEVEYANAPADRPGGQLRAKNGHPEPYGVRWWSIGNEMFGDWQLGYMGLEKYIRKHNEFAKAMRAADPSIKLIAVGAVGPWSEGMLRQLRR